MFRFRFMIASLLGVFGWALAAGAQVPGPLVDGQWLLANRTTVRILDVRVSEKAFVDGGYIAGAVFVPWRDVRVNKTVDGVDLVGMLPDPATFEALMQRAGAGNDSSIVIVNGGRNSAQITFATRLYWQLKYFGHDDVTLLDGGMAAWKKENLPVVHDPVALPPVGNFHVLAQRDNLLATTDEVEEALATKTAILFDARDFGQYLGLYHDRRSVSQGGHIPGAKFAPIDAFLMPGRVKKFLDGATLRLAVRGLGADRPSILFCNTGHFSSGTWFVLHELAGNNDASMYDGSMNAWTRSGHASTAYVAE